ncbi:hypothetical protein AU210_016373 [Fusarium oxysporum f. sp. radicis-cucumerinum]|uniref:Uncharacterized protein n=1 Tax=Fusarium oxysporum f. sp. radicis-cucumerinum TaxID=327505 RepID=A0A2H3G0G0_FUSOX|nr:hypothetical protein AU210_016373 [Fusarium oxysporum f. sp. radicis-cucumerinum]
MTVSLFDDGECQFRVDTKLRGERFVGSFAGSDQTTKRLKLIKDRGQAFICLLCNAISGLKQIVNLGDADRRHIAERYAMRINFSINSWFRFALRSAIEATAKLIIDVDDLLVYTCLNGNEMHDVDLIGGWHGGYELFDGIFDGSDINDEEGLLTFLNWLSIVLLEGISVGAEAN